MSLIRKFALAAVTTLTLLVPMTAASRANAHAESYRGNRHHHYYQVYVRSCPSEPWVSIGYSERYDVAKYWADYYYTLGYEALVR